jgi:hypothetical protein
VFNPTDTPTNSCLPNLRDLNKSKDSKIMLLLNEK